MNVLFVNRFYWPDVLGTGKTLTELAEDLAGAGMQVSVLASDTAAYDPSQRYAPHEVAAGVEIHRVRAGRFDRRKVWGWLLNALLFYPAVFFRLMRMPRHDVTVFLTDPPLLFVLGPLVRWVKKTRFVCWSQDLYPDVAVELGVLGRRSPVTVLSRWLAGWALRRADLVIALGDTMKERLVAKGVRADRIAVVHVWADAKVAYPVDDVENRFLGEHGLKGKFVVGYSGNMGLSHEFGTVLEAARMLKADEGVVFLFIGDGKQLDKVREQAAGIRSVFLPFQPEADVAHSLSAASVHVVTLKAGLEGVLVPKKLYGAMAVGRPVIFVGGERSEVAAVIREALCGFRVEPGDAAGFVRVVQRLKATTGERFSMGKRAHKAFIEKYERKLGTAKIGQLLAEVASR
jgi:glycosyltransferase involved in cell wall biosynthesis